MSRQALAERRPFLLLSVAAALAFYYLRWTAFPEFYLIPVKGAAVAMLAVYAFVRHSGPDARLLTWALGMASAGDMAIEVDQQIGGLLFFGFHVLAMGVFLRHRRPDMATTQKALAAALLLLTPLIAWLLAGEMQVAFYALALGGMAGSAWASSFPRYRVGAGAVLFVVSDLLLFARMGPLQGSFMAEVMIWPTYYLGIFLIASGVVQSLRKWEPELRVVK
ncbi:lysoplasmalogenase family protein [Altererythrobacter lauratis]|uniref:Lysoplasmalogenase family protein n=1 Tax=Alteraurantiacibacter lauratis TaxID=2054627 RepID=A0ABV7E9X3_9SPHN